MDRCFCAMGCAIAELAIYGSTILYDHGDETIRAGGDIIKAHDHII